MNKIIIIDGTNFFIRHFVVVPTVSVDGEPSGGCFGFLKSLRYLVEANKPDKVIIVFDGHGGSQRRRQINKEYKEGRKPITFSKKIDYIDVSTIDVEKNKERQFNRLLQYLENLPVYTLILDDVEADDVISYVANSAFLQDAEKIIVSTDKDFYQLLSDKITVFNPIKKIFVTKEDCKKEYNIHSKNFALARAFIGDNSDNLHGIKGIGFKTLVKYLPQFADDKLIDLNELISFSKEKQETSEKYKSFIESEELIKENYKLMRLDEPIISAHTINKINYTINEKHVNSMNVTAFKLKLMKDGISTLNEHFFVAFKHLLLTT